MLLTAPGHPSLSWVDLDDEAVSVVTLVAPPLSLGHPSLPTGGPPSITLRKGSRRPNVKRGEERDRKEILT